MDFTKSFNAARSDFCKISVSFAVHAGLSSLSPESFSQNCAVPEYAWNKLLRVRFQMCEPVLAAEPWWAELPSCLRWLFTLLAVKVTETPCNCLLKGRLQMCVAVLSFNIIWFPGFKRWSSRLPRVLQRSYQNSTPCVWAGFEQHIKRVITNSIWSAAHPIRHSGDVWHQSPREIIYLIYSFWVSTIYTRHYLHVGNTVMEK